MARTPTSPFRLGQDSITAIQNYLHSILEIHKKFNDLRNKMIEIDTAYFRYIADPKTNSGEDRVGATGVLCDEEDDVTVPVVIAQVDSFVGYLSEVFLSGYPIFPVVSEPNGRQEAEMLESIIDRHATLSGYARQFLMAFRDGVKYNFMPIEHSWEPIDQYRIVVDHLSPRDAARLEENQQYYTRITRRDPYNTVWDMRVDPAEVCYKGEYCGFVEIEPRIPLKQFINRYSQSGFLYNVGAIREMQASPGGEGGYYVDLPDVNRYMNGPQRRKIAAFDWTSWITAAGTAPKGRSLFSGIYEKFTCYARIIPSEFNIRNVPRPNSPQIWKFIFINGQTLLFAKPIFTIYDALPMLIGQPLEDGFGVQTSAIGEAQIPMQNAASLLFNIRFQAARRAISDRALYDSELINTSDINNPTAAPKIPVRLSGLNSKKLSDAYEQIPFESRGTETVIGDARNVLELSDQLSGLNKPNQGKFQKGNKSVREWVDTMGGADNRLRLPALSTEFQIMMPIKEQIKMNIFQHTDKVAGKYQNQNTGRSYNITQEQLQQLKDKVTDFRIADGFTPKAKLASTDFIVEIMQSISQNQVLAQQLGIALPGILAHLAQLGGVRGLDQYIPQEQGVSAPRGTPPQGTSSNANQGT